MFEKMKLSTKLIGSFGLILILLAGVMGIYQYALTVTTAGFTNLHRIEVAIGNHAASVEALMLQCRRNEKDFLLRLDLQYPKEHKKNLAELIKEAQAIVRLEEQAGNKQEAEKAALIITHAQEYAQSFEALVAAWEIRGLKYDAGLQETFRNIARDLANLMEGHQVEDVYIAWLEMRRYEKDYIRTKAEEDKQNLRASIETYQSLLEQSKSDAAVKQSQGNALSVYREAFDKYGRTADEPSYEQMQTAAQEMETALNQVYVPEAKALLLDIRKNEKDYLLRGEEQYVKATHNALATLLKAFEEAGVSPKYLNPVETSTNAYKEAFDALVGKDKDIATLTETMRNAVHQIEPEVSEIAKIAQAAAVSKTESTTMTASGLARIALELGIAAVMLGILLSIFIIIGTLNQLGADPAVMVAIAKKVAVGDLTLTFDTKGKPAKGVLAAMQKMVANLQDLVQVAEQIAQGDLTVTVNILSEKDALGQALTAMVAKLGDIVGDVKAVAENVATGSQNLSSSAEEMSQGATEQATSVEEASSSMEEMAANIRQNADNAAQTEKIAVKAAADTREGGKTVAETVIAMQKIAEKIMIVKEIAGQTHMLSLNATIEAAKAQEHGKGFAVVAAEVRALAERSRAAAGEINSLAGASVATAETAGAMLARLVPDIQKTAELVQEISAASGEQSTGAEQINKAIQQLDQVIQQNATVAEEMAATAEELSAQAEHLRDTIAFFTVQATSGKMHEPKERAQTGTRPGKKERAAGEKRKGAGRDEATAGRENDARPKKPAHDDLDADFERY